MASTPEPSKASADDMRAKFKAALDAKNAKRRESDRADHDTSASGTGGARSAGSKPRMFRRKAGG